MNGPIKKTGIVLTKEGKMFFVILILLLIIVGFIVVRTLSADKDVNKITLDANLLTEGDQINIDSDKTTLKIHLDSKVQLNYTTSPVNKSVNYKIIYDEEIVNIDSSGIVSGKKVGTTNIQLKYKNTKSNLITVHVY